jgi:transposase-like protein
VPLSRLPNDQPHPDTHALTKVNYVISISSSSLLNLAMPGAARPGCLLSQVTKVVLERALAEEMTGHLGYEKHDPAGRGRGNRRNGTIGKTLLTDASAVELAVPRDRNGSFDPKIVRPSARAARPRPSRPATHRSG